MENKKSEIVTMDDFLQSEKKKIAAALPRALRPDRLIRIALAAMSKTPKLRQCTRDSVLTCIMDLAGMGLEPDGRRAYLIPYEDKKNNRTICQLQIGYIGLADLARRSGQVGDIHCDVVGKNDKFSFSHGVNSHLTHEPALGDRGEIIAAYSFVKLKDGTYSFDVMSTKEIEAIKERSQGWKAFKAGYTKSCPWSTDWNEMAKKTVFRRHTKTLPMSSESSELIQMAVEKDYDTPIDITPESNGKPSVSMPKEKEPEQTPVTDPADVPGDAQETDEVVTEPPADKETELICSDCKIEIEQNVYAYSLEKFGKALCFKCQKKNKGGR